MGIVAVLAAVVGIAFAVAHAGDSAAGWLDRSVAGLVGDQSADPSTPALMLAAAGDPIVAVTLAGLLAGALLVIGRRRLAVVAIVGLAVTGVASTVLLKPVIGRTIHDGNLSYPSGHTAAVTVLALVVALLAVDLLRAGRLTGLLIVLTGAGAAGGATAWSQIALNLHYPTDTVGGFCTAMAVVPLTALLVDGFRVAPVEAGVTGD